MLFNSKEFIFMFLPVVLIVFLLLRSMGGYRLCQLWIIASSLGFYAWSDLRQLPYLVGSVIFNFIVCTLLTRMNAKESSSFALKSVFWLGILGNLSLLGYCKYAAFILDNVTRLTGLVVAHPQFFQPIGISFFTITQIIVLVDAYDGGTEKTDLLQYVSFATFFPCLLSGPIMQQSEVLPQFKERWSGRVLSEDLVRGITLFSIGLTKKVAIADTFAVWANIGFEKVASLQLIEAWATVLCFALQLYFDFSGYTDMAVGVGRMFGIRLPFNFNAPYRALNVIEFWQRWHITLSSFITGYVYYPIVRSLPGFNFFFSLLAVMLAMLVSGLWHGASWTYVLWGALHGLAIVINHIWAKLKIQLWAPIAWLLTFVFLMLSFVIFRAKDLTTATVLYKNLFGMNGITLPMDWSTSLASLKSFGVAFGPWISSLDPASASKPIIWIVAGMLMATLPWESNEFSEKIHPTLETAIIAALLTLIGLSMVLTANRLSDFLYFQF